MQCLMHMLYLVIVALLLRLSQQHRSLLKTGNVPSRDDGFQQFGIPPDAVILVELDISEAQPQQSPADTRRMCTAFRDARKCMNVSETEAIYVGKNCSGSECFMKPHPGPASCMSNITNVPVDLHNATRRFTCGADPDSHAVLNPNIPSYGPPSSSALKHIVGLPDEIEVHVWNLCLKGELQQVVRVTFKEAPPNNYTCKGNIMCTDQGIIPYGWCYSVEDGVRGLHNGIMPPGMSAYALFLVFFPCIIFSFHLLA